MEPDQNIAPYNTATSPIPAGNFIQQYPAPGNSSSNFFVFSLDDALIQETQNGYHHFHFKGFDLEGNTLLGLDR
ncbi:MAG: hypothetical protein R3B47_08970 [Bacteroidia bacterium]